MSGSKMSGVEAPESYECTDVDMPQAMQDSLMIGLDGPKSGGIMAGGKMTGKKTRTNVDSDRQIMPGDLSGVIQTAGVLDARPRSRAGNEGGTALMDHGIDAANDLLVRHIDNHAEKQGNQARVAAGAGGVGEQADGSVDMLSPRRSTRARDSVLYKEPSDTKFTPVRTSVKKRGEDVMSVSARGRAATERQGVMSAKVLEAFTPAKERGEGPATVSARGQPANSRRGEAVVDVSEVVTPAIRKDATSGSGYARGQPDTPRQGAKSRAAVSGLGAGGEGGSRTARSKITKAVSHAYPVPTLLCP